MPEYLKLVHLAIKGSTFNYTLYSNTAARRDGTRNGGKILIECEGAATGWGGKGVRRGIGRNCGMFLKEFFFLFFFSNRKDLKTK